MSEPIEVLSAKWNPPILKLKRNDETKLNIELKIGEELPGDIRLVDEDGDVIEKASTLSMREGCFIEFEAKRYELTLTSQV